MKVYKNLYVGDTVKKPERLIKKLKKHKKPSKFYVIAFDKETDSLSIYHSLMLTQWYYKEYPPACIVGLANDKEEAFALIEQIAAETLAATGRVSLVEYLSRTDPESFQG
ncbi:MAG: hypothetical protein HDR16_01120 [Lachnospiraceae bacterium]|nr:hypothetical protein [Lachnospiraceae bacterium]